METILSIDFSILNGIQQLRCGFLDTVLSSLSSIGHAGIVWIVLSILLLFFKKTRAAGVIALLAMGFGYLMYSLK